MRGYTLNRAVCKATCSCSLPFDGVPKLQSMGKTKLFLVFVRHSIWLIVLECLIKWMKGIWWVCSTSNWFCSELIDLFPSVILVVCSETWFQMEPNSGLLLFLTLTRFPKHLILMFSTVSNNITHFFKISKSRKEVKIVFIKVYHVPFQSLRVPVVHSCSIIQFSLETLPKHLFCVFVGL